MQFQSATVTATFSRRMQITLQNGDVLSARIKGKKLRPVCGDVVTAGPIENESDWLITSITDRRNELARPNLRGDAEVLAANIDQLVVVCGALPEPDWFIVDRYLWAAESMNAAACVVYNKLDLAGTDELEQYAALSYPTLQTSAETGAGLDELQTLLANKTSIFAGQSGVGKSSLINAILGSEQQKVADISTKHEEGRHTTVNSVMLNLPDDARVIDSPGVRDFAPSITEGSDIAGGFVEIEAASVNCRFANCRHLKEPGCAVKRGLDDGEINERRYESYRRLYILTQKLAEKRY